MIGGTVNRFANERLTATRLSGGFYDSGRWENGSSEPFQFLANVQPARPADLERLPENYRNQAAFWVYPKTSITLRTGAAATGNADGVVADLITFEGIEYQVVGAERWRRHNRYLIAKVTQ